MPFVWRYENAEGRGPYQGTMNGPLKEMHRTHAGADWPRWSQDFKIQWRDNSLISGFPSWAAAVNWFDGFHELLVECGYTLYRYWVPASEVEVGFSRKQLRFYRPVEYE